MDELMDEWMELGMGDMGAGSITVGGRKIDEHMLS